MSICPTGMEAYTIKSGDTFYSIALKFDISIQELMRANPNIHPYGLLVGQNICIPKLWNLYSNNEYNISFKYPSTWKKINNESYEGKDGFFIISAIAAKGSIESVCKNEIRHRLMPYGSNPKVLKLKIENQEACLILPSEDQREDMKDESALIIRYPSPVNIRGKRYNYFIIWSNRSYIRKIGSTITFLDK